MQFLDEAKRVEVASRMEGEEYKLNPIIIDGVVDHATAREISGSKFG